MNWSLKKTDSVGDGVNFGVPSSLNDYKFVLVPTSDNKYGRNILGGYSNLKNKKELVTFPNQSISSEKYLELKDLINSSNAEKIATSYFNYLQPHVKLSNITDASSFFAKYNDLEKIQNNFGIIPEAINNRAININDILDMESRYDLILDSTTSNKRRRATRNAKRISKPSTYTDNTILLSYAPKIIDESNLNNLLYNKFDTGQTAIINAEDLDNEILLKIKKSLILNQYTIGSEDTLARDEQSFNLYIIDKYGQYTKVYNNGSGNITFSSEEPQIDAVQSNNTAPNLSELDDRFDFKFKGINLQGITKVVLRILEIGSGDTIQRSDGATGLLGDFVFPSIQTDQGSRDGFIFRNVLQKKKRSLTLSIEKLSNDISEGFATFREGLNVDSGIKLEIELFRKGKLSKKFNKVFIERDDEEEIEEVDYFDSNDVRAQGLGEDLKIYQ